MNNLQDEYNRLHDHCQAIARERDWLQLEVERLKFELNNAHKQINAAHKLYRKMKTTVEMLETHLQVANSELVEQWVANATQMP